MQFDWDDEKAEQNLQTYGVDFLAAVEVFADPRRVTLPARRGADGETRRIAVGQVGDDVLAVVYAMRGRTTRMISAREATSRERKAYRR